MLTCHFFFSKGREKNDFDAKKTGRSFLFLFFGLKTTTIRHTEDQRRPVDDNR